MSIPIIMPAIAGIIGGVAIAGIGMVYRAAVGQGFWSLPNSIGGIALGPEAGATLPFGIPTITGVALHMVLSAIYGILIVFLAPTTGLGFIGTGILVGLGVWVVNHYMIGAFHPGSNAHAKLNPIWLAFLLHALYGGVAGLVVDLMSR